MKNHYEVTENEIIVDGEPMMSYGIMIFRENDTAEKIDDVFLEYSRAKEFVDLLNVEEADPVHLAQLIEEALSVG